MEYDRPLVEEELSPFRTALKRMIQGEPLEHVLGEIAFFHCQIQTGPSALIPRQETEILLDLVCKKIGDLRGRALDLCTGTGCLAIGLKKAHPELEVFGVDLSEKALQLAQSNGKKNDVSIDWRLGDLTAAVKDTKFDLVICNPPYISEAEYATLAPGVRNFEPKMALVSGASGYEFFERLAVELPSILNDKAAVFFELGTGQGPRVLELFSSKNWHQSRVESDWSGHDRFFASIFLEIE